MNDAARAMLALLLVVGCDDDRLAQAPHASTVQTSTVQTTAAPSDRAHLRDDARLVLERYCGQCHIRGYDSAVPGALAVFDLSDLEWSARMSTAQLEDARGRVRDRRGPEGDLPITDDEVARVEAFVAGEIARRP